MDEKEIHRLLFSAVQHHNESLLNDLLESEDGIRLLDLPDEDGNMLLHVAVMEGELDCVRCLLKHGADPNIFDVNRARSPLHLAVELGLVKVVTAFLELQHVNLDLRDDRNLTCYEIALFCDNKNLADLIRERQDEIEKIKDEFYSIMNQACTKSDAKLVKELIARHERRIIQNLPKNWLQHRDKKQYARLVIKDLINWSSSSWNDVTLLFKSASKGHTDICRALIELGASPRCNESTNYSPLYVAAYGGHTSTVKLLLENFPSLIQEITIERWTVLHACCLQGHSETSKLILNYPYPDSLKQRYVTQNGQYEYYFAFNLNSQDAAGQTAVYLAVSANNESLLDTLLDFNIEARRIAPVEGTDVKSLSNHANIISNRVRIIADKPTTKDGDRNSRFYPSSHIDRLMKQLRKLQFSKEPDTVISEQNCVNESEEKYLVCPFEMDTYCDYNSKTALHLAVCQQYHTIVTTLLVNGSDPNLPIMFRDLNKSDQTNAKENSDVGLGWLRSSKSTCLKEACKLNDESMCDILIRYGARDTQDNVALKVAVANKNSHIITMFLSLKSNVDPEYKINRKCNVEFASRYKQSQKLSKTSELGNSTSTTTFSSMFPSNPVTICWQNLECIQHIDPQWLIEASLVHNKRLRHPTNSLMAITRLDLSSNNLKSVHPVIFRLPSLRELNLSDNRLETLLDMSQESHDAEAYTPTSKLIESHRIAMKRSKSSNFTGVNLESSNRIDLNEPQDWDLPALEIMDLHNNLLISLPDCLFSLPKLRELDVSSNQLRQLPWALWTAPGLRELIASGNLLDDLPKAPTHSRLSSGVSSPLTTISDHHSDGETSSVHASNTSFEKLESSFASSAGSIHDNKEPNYIKCLLANQTAIHEQSVKLVSLPINRTSHWSKRIDLVDNIPVVTEEANPDSTSTTQRQNRSFSQLTYINLSHNSFIMIPPVLACVAAELTRLNMSFNRIESLGDISLYPSKLKTLDLSNNRLISWFQFSLQDDDTKHCYTENIRRIPVAKSHRGHNSLYCVHKIHQRLDYLKSMNLSHNLMRDIQLAHQHLQQLQQQSTANSKTSRDIQSNSPVSKQASLLYPNITALDLSFNHIQKLPEGLSDLRDLSVLNISGNPSITTLPAELGLAHKLWNLGVNGCNLGEPLKSIVESKSYKTMDIIGYLRSILEEAKPYARMKLMLVGLQGIGKTSLLEQMRHEGSSGSRFRTPEHWTKRMGHSSRGNLRNQKGVTLSTVGVDIHDWIYQKRVPRNQHNFGPVSFSTWDFGGQHEFYATHRYFLSRRSIYLVVWRLIDGMDGILGIQQWLVNIQSRAPGSPVIIVGTHEDMIEGGERGPVAQKLQAEVQSRFINVSDNDKCGLPKVMDSIMVSIKTKLNIKNLCNRIYDIVFSLRCPGSTERLLEQKIPATYLYLEEIVCWIAHDRNQKKREPVLTYEEYRKLTSEQLKKRYNKVFRDLEPLNSREINYNSELHQATRFLHENGVLLHYEDTNLRDLYFLDPQWLCDLLSHVVTIREINPHVKNGLMKMDDLGFLFKSMDVHLSGGVQSYVVNLLNKFEVALTWNSQYLLIPSLLPNKPELLNEQQDFHVKQGLKMRGRSVVKRIEPSRGAHRSSSIDPIKRPQDILTQDSHSVKNFYEFRYKPESSVTRLILLRYLPAGFLARLQSSILSDPVFDDACEGIFQDIVERVARKNKDASIELANIIGNRPSWLCWQNGIRLTLQQESTINTKNDPKLLAPNLMSIEQYTGDPRESPLGGSKFKIECLQIDCVDKQGDDVSVAPSRNAARKWVDFDVTQYSNIIAVVLPNPELIITKKSDQSVDSYDLDHSSCAKLLARAVDYIDDLLEDWYPSLGARFAHTLGGDYLVTRIIPCLGCSSTLPLVNTTKVSARHRRSTRATARASEGSKVGQSGANDAGRQATSEEVYCFYVEHCILHAYDLAAPITGRHAVKITPQSPKRHLVKAKNLNCPIHGAIAVSDVAPDIVFDDLLDSFKIDSDQIDRYKLIGRGALGFVFKGNLRNTNYPLDHNSIANQEVALKLLQPVDPGPEADQTDVAAYQSAKSSWSREPFQNACKSYCTARHEVNILQSLYHPNIVSFIGLCLRPIAIVLELAPLGSLADVFKNYKRANMRIDQFTVQKSLLQVAKALEFLHQHRIIYRDLKTENILVWAFPSPFATNLETAQVELKLADYGISRQALSTGIWKGFAGTMSFLAPEILRHNGDEEYTEKVDCFSFGMFMYELLTLRPPSNKQGDFGAAGGVGYARSGHFSDSSCRPTLSCNDSNYPNYMLDLMSLCWSQEPHDRPTASQIVSIVSTPEFMRVHDTMGLSPVDVPKSKFDFPPPQYAIEYEHSLSLLYCASPPAQLNILSTNQDQWAVHKSFKPSEIPQDCSLSAMCLVDKELWLCLTGGVILVTPTEEPLSVDSNLDRFASSSSPDRPSIDNRQDLNDSTLALRSFKIIANDQSHLTEEIKSMLHVKHARSVIFLTRNGGLWLLPLDRMTCDQLEDSSIKFNCISAPDDEEHTGEVQAGDDVSFRLFCGQCDGISCLEIYNNEVRRQSILPIMSSNAQSDATEEVSSSDSLDSQATEITNIVAVGDMLWTSGNSTVHLWSIREKRVVRKLDCAKLVPCSESLESINIEVYYQQAKTSSVTSMVYEKNQLYVGTSHGCLIVIEASSLKPLIIFKPFERNAIILSPMLMATKNSAQQPRQHLVAVGQGYRDLMKRYLNFLEDSSQIDAIAGGANVATSDKSLQALTAILITPTSHYDL